MKLSGPAGQVAPRHQRRWEVLTHTQFEGDREISRTIDRSWPGPSRSEIHLTGHIVRTLEAALWSVARNGCFRSAVVLTADLADVADTAAARTGQLAGAIFWLSGIPEHWPAVVTEKDRFLKSAHRLLEPVARGLAHTPDTAADGRDAPMRGPAGLNPSRGTRATDLRRSCPGQPSGKEFPTIARGGRIAGTRGGTSGSGARTIGAARPEQPLPDGLAGVATCRTGGGTGREVDNGRVRSKIRIVGRVRANQPANGVAKMPGAANPTLLLLRGAPRAASPRVRCVGPP